MPTSERLSPYHFMITEDGSSTIRISETMHSLRGAFSETVYVYGTALEHALSLTEGDGDPELQKAKPLEVLSLGLGLGYNEILTAALAERARPDVGFSRLVSLESDSNLTRFFTSWVVGDLKDVPSEFLAAYDDILERTAAHAEVKSDRIKRRLEAGLASGHFVPRGALSADTRFTSRFSCFLFDAFSSKTSPELWSEEFLTGFLAATSGEQAVFSTYACTGALKRALRASGFEVQIREGFSSKRDCTFATRSP